MADFSSVECLIVGGGAAGMTAAITAARHGAHVVLLDAGERPGKKLLRTGNGRCNVTNDGCRTEAGRTAAHYFGKNPAFAAEVIQQFDIEKTINFFNSIGIFLRSFDGWYYPYNEEASSVRDAMQDELIRLGVKVKTNECVRSVSVMSDGTFEVKTDYWKYLAKGVLLACGSKASLPDSAPDGYEIAKTFGHHIEPLLPSLVGLTISDRRSASSWSGVRARAGVSLLVEGKTIHSEDGQVQFNAKGLSGIPIMNASAKAAAALHQNLQVSVVLDFLRGLDQIPADPKWLLPRKLTPIILKGCQSESEIEHRLRNYSVPITGSGSLSEAQIASGGISTSEVDPVTMESRLIPGLFFAGEILDVAGECGGYNLQFAWSSGAAAGRGLASII